MMQHFHLPRSAGGVAPFQFYVPGTGFGLLDVSLGRRMSRSVSYSGMFLQSTFSIQLLGSGVTQTPLFSHFLPEWKVSTLGGSVPALLTLAKHLAEFRMDFW